MPPAAAADAAGGDPRPRRVSSVWRTKPELGDFHAPVKLDIPSKEQLEALWRVLDRQGDRQIDYNDFLDLARGNREKAQALWNEIAAWFDADGSGHVTPFEFIQGMKKIALSQPLDQARAFTTTPRKHIDMQRAIQASANICVMNLCKKIYDSCAPGVPVTTQAPSPFWQEHPGIDDFAHCAGEMLYISTENKAAIEEAFGKLDENKDGTLTLRDFDPKEGKPSRYDVWDRLRTFLDANGDGSITPEEFVGAFKKFALTFEMRPYASVPASHNEAAVHLNKSLNERIKIMIDHFMKELGV